MEQVGQEANKKLVSEPQTYSETSSGSAQKKNRASKGDPYGHTQESVDRFVARALGRRITDVLDSIFFFSQAEIKTLDIKKDNLQLIVNMPFVLPASSQEGGLWWDTAAAQNKLRRDFAKHLRGSKF